MCRPIAPMASPPSRGVMAKMWLFDVSSCPAIHSAAAPSGYGCGISSVLAAMARSEASRWIAGASSGVNGRSARRAVMMVGRGIRIGAGDRPAPRTLLLFFLFGLRGGGGRHLEHRRVHGRIQLNLLDRDRLSALFALHVAFHR